jgi:hypothetical protein
MSDNLSPRFHDAIERRDRQGAEAALIALRAQVDQLRASADAERMRRHRLISARVLAERARQGLPEDAPVSWWSESE